MDKRRLHYWWTLIRPIKVWYLLTLLLISAVIMVASLRSNNLTMIQLRDEVFIADKNNGDVEGSLQRLRAYVHSHMNTKLHKKDGAYPPIQLMYTYERLKQAEKQRVQDANAQVYSDAQSYCEGLFPGSFSGGPRLPCIEQYVTERGVKEKGIPNALYKFDFTSPTWSPDVAGFSVVTTSFLGLALILRLTLGIVLKKLS
ncbi:MAG TPA: hypothetical protein VD735_01005, partial [Candidatus Saccharimonadales bacterium]|nr:hypothetical protein [Candidatus Saccharimonadales bacterium]